MRLKQNAISHKTNFPILPQIRETDWNNGKIGIRLRAIRFRSNNNKFFTFLAMNVCTAQLHSGSRKKWVVVKKGRNYVIFRWNIYSGCAVWTSASFPISYGNAKNSIHPMHWIHIACLFNDAFYCICKNCKPIFWFRLFLPSFYKLIFCLYYEKHRIDSYRYSNETGGGVVLEIIRKKASDTKQK